MGVWCLIRARTWNHQSLYITFSLSLFTDHSRMHTHDTRRKRLKCYRWPFSACNHQLTVAAFSGFPATVFKLQRPASRRFSRKCHMYPSQQLRLSLFTQPVHEQRSVFRFHFLLWCNINSKERSSATTHKKYKETTQSG